MTDSIPPDAANSGPRRQVQRIVGKLGIGRQALGDGSAGLLIQVVTLVATFVSFSLLGRKLGPTQYGAFAAMYSLVGITIGLSYIGPGFAFLQHAMQSTVKQVSSEFFSVHLLAGAVAVSLAFSVAHFILPHFSLITLSCFMVAELIGIALVQLAGTLRLIVTGYRSTVVLNLLPVMLKLVAIVGLALGGRLSLRNYGIVYMVLCTVAGIAVFQRVTTKLEIPRRVAPIKAEYLRTTLTISMTIWAFNLHNGGDQLTMSANRVGAVLGLYAAAYRLISFGTIPINAIVDSSYRSFLDPAIGRQRQRALKYSLFSVIYTVVATTGLILFAAIAMPIIVGKGFDGAITMVRWLAPLMIIRGLSPFPLNALMGFGRPSARLFAIITSATIAMTLYITLIPKYSWKGAAVGSYCSDFALLVIGWGMVLWYDKRPRPVPLTESGAPDPTTTSGDAVTEFSE